MATRKQISYGSQGDEVRELQTVLNNSGYNLTVDGVFGSKTQAAVKDYQTKNSLQADGIVGEKTWGSLFPEVPDAAAPDAGTVNTAPTAPAEPEAPKKSAAQLALENAPKYESPAYQESELVAQAKAALQTQMNNKPGAYQSTYQQQIDEVLNKILNREEFSYDLNGDALYQQYKDQYTAQGKQAMMDAMGQAAALTGGYGSSYAQGVGQQTYQGYLQQLNDKVPELYQLALEQYNRKGEDLFKQYSLYTDRENTEYNRYRDDVGDYYTNLDYLTNQYQNERNFDYGKYSDDRNFGYQVNRDQLNDTKWQTEFDEALRQYNESMQYQKDRDAVSDEQWQKEFEEAQRQFNVANGGSGGGSGGGSKTSLSYEDVYDIVREDYVYGNGNLTQAENDIKTLVDNGVITREQGSTILLKVKQEKGSSGASPLTQVSMSPTANSFTAASDKKKETSDKKKKNSSTGKSGSSTKLTK